MLQARAALARVAWRSGGPAAAQRRALLFASQNNVAVAGGLKVQTAVVRAAAHPMHWSTMCATSAQLNGQLLASPTPGDVRGTVDGVASVLLRHFSSQSGAGDSSGADEVEASDSEPPKREIPTNGDISTSSKTYFVVDPLKGHGDALHPLVDGVRRGKWCTMVGPRRQGKSTTVLALAKTRHKGTSVACVCYVEPSICAKHGDGEDLLKALLLPSLPPAHSEKLSAMSVVEWLKERHSAGHKTYIFLDEFDVLASPAVNPDTATSFVSVLRMLRQLFGDTLTCAAVGSTRSVRVRTRFTSPFNTNQVVSAPPFSPAQVKELMQMAVDEEVLVPDDMDFADHIHAFCAGHRGMVCMCAYELQVARSKGEPWTIERWDDFCTRMVEIAAGDVEAVQLADHLADLDKQYPASDVSDVLAAAVVGTKLDVDDDEPVWAATVTTLADCGFLVLQDRVSFVLTSPLYGSVLRRRVVKRGHAGIPTVADVVHYHPDGELDVGSTLLRCLKKLTAAHLIRLANMTTVASKDHPSENAFCTEVGSLLRTASRKVPNFHVANEVGAGGKRRVDMVLDLDDQRHLVEFVAHGRSGGFRGGELRAGSVAEHYERVRSSYAVKLGVPLERCWLVCFGAWANSSSCREAMWPTLDELPAADRGTLDAPAINVMWVVHSNDFKQAAYHIDLAGGCDTRVGGAVDGAAASQGAGGGAGAGAASGTRAVIGKWTPFVFA